VYDNGVAKLSDAISEWLLPAFLTHHTINDLARSWGAMGFKSEARNTQQVQISKFEFSKRVRRVACQLPGSIAVHQFVWDIRISDI
jgi:hypothetical protein